MNDWYELELGEAPGNVSASVGAYATFSTIDVQPSTGSTNDFTSCLQAKLELILEKDGVMQASFQKVLSLKEVSGKLEITPRSFSLSSGS